MNILEQLDNDTRLKESQGLFVVFYAKELEDPIESEKQGYKVFKTVDCIKISWDNDDSVVDRQVIHSDDPDHIDYVRSDIRRFPRIWAAYRAGKKDSDQIFGIPLEHLFPNDPGKSATYKHYNIRTVEQLAETPDTTIQRFAGGMADKQLAQRYISKSRDNFAQEQQIVMINNVKEENDFLKQQMEAMRLEMSKLVEAKLKDAKAETKTKKVKVEEPVEV